MKYSILAISFLSALVANAAETRISVPQAPVITYGMIRDEYGAPLTKACAAELRLVTEADREGQTFAKCEVGEMGIPGMNYRLSLEIDSSGPTRPYAVLKGTEMRVLATVGGSDESLTPKSTFVTPKQGTKQRLDYSIGEDADGDGMPDAWEEWVLLVAGLDADADDIAAFKPNGDADGDGMTNLQEFGAGTDPFLSTDVFAITAYTKDAAPGRSMITFTTSLDRTYRLLACESLDNPVWYPVATSYTPEGELSYQTHPGSGRSVTVFVGSGEGPEMFFKVAAE